MPDILRLTGLSTKLHNYPDQLSGGEQQRVSVARAFVNHPPLLLADEPTGNLDPETSIGIMQLLYRINRTGTTVVVATHDSHMVDRMRRRVIELDRGRIVRDERAGRYAPSEDDHRRVRRAAAPSRRPSPQPRRRARRTGSRRELRLAFFLREAMRSMWRNAIPSFAAMASVLVTVLVLGVFIPIVQATTGAANEVRGRVLVDVYLKTDATPGDVERVHDAPRHAARQEVEYVSKKQAYAEQERKRNPEAYELLGLESAARHVPDHARRPGQRAQAPRRARAAAPRPAGGRRSTRRSTRSRTARTRRRRSSRRRAS